MAMGAGLGRHLQPASVSIFHSEGQWSSHENDMDITMMGRGLVPSLGHRCR